MTQSLVGRAATTTQQHANIKSGSGPEGGGTTAAARTVEVSAEHCKLLSCQLDGYVKVGLTVRRTVDHPI